MTVPHPTAIVSAHARVHPSASIGPYCVVGPTVELGPHVILEPHVVIQGRTHLAAHNHVFPFACLGGPPQDRGPRTEDASLIIGEGNIIREYVTFNCGTPLGTSQTNVGALGYFMAHSHVGHDCTIGDRVVFANGAAAAGFSTIEDDAQLGGMAGVHQFARVGRLAMVGAGAMVAQDVPPFTLAQGDRARLIGLNQVGLQRAAITPAARGALKQAFRLLFRSGLNRSEAIQQIREEVDDAPEIQHLLTFVLSSTRGICRARSEGPGYA